MKPIPLSPSEAETRAQWIDKALEKADWKLDDPHLVGEEIPVDGFDPKEWQKLQSQIGRMIRDEAATYTVLPAGISDYVLYRENGEVLAVVEAKKTTVDARIAEAQAALAGAPNILLWEGGFVNRGTKSQHTAEGSQGFRHRDGNVRRRFGEDRKERGNDFADPGAVTDLQV